ncbi:MAG: FMN-dependent NADH-azoreductase [Alphaproteobacteria bacterium]|nr:MAG: FMN-dependent NADH-azoreductase [Alphaproteobacteria bacterium]
MNLLHIDTSILGDASVSRQLSADIVAKLTTEAPGTSVTYINLAESPLPHVTLPQLGTPQAAQVLQQFKSADVLVIGTPMYNFGIPSQLKAYIDHIAIAGQTFKYTAEGPIGLMGGKRVILASSTGGIYAEGTPGFALNHQTEYLKAVFGFLGIKDIEVITAQGVAMGDEPKAAAIASAKQAISQLHA